MWLLAQNCESFDQLQQRFYRQVNFDTFYHCAACALTVFSGRIIFNAKAARPGGLAAFMLIKNFYSTSSSAKIHSTSLIWEPLRE